MRNVARHYDFLAYASQKWVDWCNLMVVVAMLYGSKIHAVKRRTENAAAPRPPAMRGNGMMPVVAPLRDSHDDFAVEIPREGEALQ